MKRAIFFTTELAQAAVDIVRPMIETAMANGLVKRNHLHVVIASSRVQPTNGPGAGFSGAVVHRESFGDQGEWQHPYHEIAYAKARQTWETGVPSPEMPLYPLLYQEGDTPYVGSAMLPGVVVGVSGVEDFFDEMFARAVAAACVALAKRELLKWRQENQEENFFS